MQYLSNALQVNTVRWHLRNVNQPFNIFLPQTLRTLNLDFNRIDHVGALSLADALQVNKVKWLLSSIGGCFIFLYFAQTLTELDLHCNYISYQGAWNLTSALQSNTVGWHTSISRLLSSNIYRDSKHWVLNSIRFPTKEQRLWHVHWKWTEWSYISTHLTNCRTILPFEQTLTTLNLRNNQIGNEGAEYLSNALKVNTARWRLFNVDHSFTVCISYRNLQHSSFRETSLNISEHPI